RAERRPRHHGAPHRPAGPGRDRVSPGDEGGGTEVGSVPDGGSSERRASLGPRGHAQVRRRCQPARNRMTRREPMQTENLPRAVPPPAAARYRRGGPPLLSAALYWAAGFFVGRLDKPYFYGFLYGMGSATLLALVFFGWWFSRRSIRLRDRLLGFLLVVVG